MYLHNFTSRVYFIIEPSCDITVHVNVLLAVNLVNVDYGLCIKPIRLTS